MRANKLLIIGNYVAGNLGDDAILAGILTDLKELDFKGSLAITHGGIRTSLDLYRSLTKLPFAPVGLRSRMRLGKQVEKAWAPYTLAILGGGGLFTDAESWRAPYIWYRQAKLLRKLKIPYLIFGQSVGPLNSTWSRWFAKKTFLGAKAIHLRDEESASILKKWGIQNVTVGTDPALSWLQTQKERNLKKQNIFLLSLRNWPGFKAKNWLELSKPINEWAKKKNLKPMLISMEPTSVKEKKLLETFSWEVYYPQSAREAFLAFQKANAAFTMRLHASVFALMAKTPFLALNYSKKVEALFRSLKQESHLLNPENCTEESLRTGLKNLQPPKNFNSEALIQANRAFLKRELDLD